MKTYCRQIFAVAVCMMTSSYISADTIPTDISAPSVLPVEIKDSVSTEHLPKNKGRETVGLVLSGGGAKGIAHVGIIKALEENDIPIDYVTGTSMGAIVGSLYSCGWSPEKMLDMFMSQEFQDWSAGVLDKDKIYYYSRPEPTPKWVSVNLRFNSDESPLYQVIPSSLISPLPLNIEFLKIFSPYTEQCSEDFNHLFVPFRCVASDVYTKKKVVFSRGSLGDAVRASMSFPLVYRPITIDGTMLFDGGIYDNFPVNVMEEDFDPDFVIGVSVSGADTRPIQGDIYSQLEDMIIQNNDYTVPHRDGIKIQVPVLNYGVLSFNKAKTIYEIGYKTGLEMVDSIKSRVKARESQEVVRERRAAFAHATPEVMFDSVEVYGVNKDESNYLEYVFRGLGRKRFGLGQTERAYYRAVTAGTLSNLVPQVVFGKDGNNILKLEATLRRPWSIGAGGWVTTSANSMVFLTFGYHTLDYNSLDISLNGWVGQSYMAGLLRTRFSLRTKYPSMLQLDLVMSRQKFYDSEVLFYKSNEPTFITEIDNFARLSYIWAMGSKYKGYTSVAGGYLSDSYFPASGESYAGINKDLTQYRAGVIKAGVTCNSLNNEMYPSEGVEWRNELMGSYEQSRYSPEGDKNRAGKYQGALRASLEIYWRQFFKIGRHFSLGALATGYGTLQPLHNNYTATLIHAPAFAPTPATKNYFNAGFRSDNFLAAGVIPIWMPMRNLQLRGDFYAFTPIRDLKDRGLEPAEYGRWFGRAEYIAELAIVYNFPFASLSVYGNYLSSPKNNWNFGLNFGLLFGAPKLLK